MGMLVKGCVGHMYVDESAFTWLVVQGWSVEEADKTVAARFCVLVDDSVERADTSAGSLVSLVSSGQVLEADDALALLAASSTSCQHEYQDFIAHLSAASRSESASEAGVPGVFHTAAGKSHPYKLMQCHPGVLQQCTLAAPPKVAVSRRELQCSAVPCWSAPIRHVADSMSVDAWHAPPCRCTVCRQSQDNTAAAVICHARNAATCWLH